MLFKLSNLNSNLALENDGKGTKMGKLLPENWS